MAWIFCAGAESGLRKPVCALGTHRSVPTAGLSSSSGGLSSISFSFFFLKRSHNNNSPRSKNAYQRLQHEEKHNFLYKQFLHKLTNPPLCFAFDNTKRRSSGERMPKNRFSKEKMPTGHMLRLKLITHVSLYSPKQHSRVLHPKFTSIQTT